MKDEEGLLGKDGKRKSGGEWRMWILGLYVGRTRRRRRVVLEIDRRSFVADRRSCNACMGVIIAVAILSIEAMSKVYLLLAGGSVTANNL